jgi:parallel beta-helix repeat protein
MNMVLNNSISSNNADGIRLEKAHRNVIMYNNITENTYFGIYITQSAHNKIVHNNFIKNCFGRHTQAYDDTDMNHWNFSDEGNYWSDLVEPDADRDGIVDTPYVLSGNANAKDYYPLVHPIWIGRQGQSIVMIVVILVLNVVGICILVTILIGLRRSVKK